MESPLIREKAALFKLSEEDLNELLPEFDPDSGRLHFEFDQWKERFLADLAKRGIPIHRGDIIAMPSYRDRDHPDDTEKWIFDGQKVLEFEMSHAKGKLPWDFEVITEFPINYWEGLLDSNLVPYFFPDNHEKAEIEDIQTIKEKGVKYFYFPFTIKGREYKLIADFSTKVDREDPLNSEDFFEALERAHYYQTAPRYDKPGELRVKPNHLYLPM